VSHGTGNVHWRSLLADADRYVHYDGKVPSDRRSAALARMGALVTHPGLQATAVYRFGSYVHSRSLGATPDSRAKLLRLIFLPVSKISQIITGIWISPVAEIGPGFYIAHFGGVILGPCKIGENCNLGHGVTVGKSGRGARAGNPKIGDRVNLAAGARVLGDVVIGDDVLVGANSVVNRSLPPRAVAVGVPAKVVSRKGAFEYVDYPGMDGDPARTASMAALDVPNGTVPSTSLDKTSRPAPT
jgi:serine O-acetyltransferase